MLLRSSRYGVLGLHYTVFNSEISVSIKTVEAVAYWLVPTTHKEVRSYVQLCNFYTKFIHRFSDLTAPVTD
jgi:hypothetical protein